MTDREEELTPTFSEAFASAMRESGFGKIDPEQPPTGAALLGALGGVRGLIESFTPGFAFLVLYTITQNLLVSVLVPVGIAVLFVVARAVVRSPVTPAIAGAVGIGLTALLAILTNRAENNFLPGIVINAAVLILLLVSLLARWPLVGVVVAPLLGRGTEWRSDRAALRAFSLATWVWAVPSVIRLAVQVPLYLAERPDLLAASKLLTGIPLQLGALWVTWLLVRAIYPRLERTAEQ